MKFSTRYSFLSIAFLIQAIEAASETFNFKLDAPGTALEGKTIYITKDKSIMIGTADKPASGTIQDDGTLLMEDGTTMGIGKNFLSETSQSSSWKVAEPWTIVDGKLKLYDGDFHSVFSGEGDNYAMGSKNALAGRSDMIPFSIIPVDADGNVVPDYSGSTVSSSAASSSAASTSSFLTSTTSASSSSEADVTSEEPKTSVEPEVSSSKGEESQVTSAPAQSSAPADTSAETSAPSETSAPAQSTPVTSTKAASSVASVTPFYNGALKNSGNFAAVLLAAYALV